MTGFDVITLVAKTFTTDELGQRIPAESERTVFARMDSISQSEFFEAARVGLKPEYRAVLSFAEDYDGEEIAVYNDKRYAIYRTYRTDSGQMELYLQREVGA